MAKIPKIVRSRLARKRTEEFAAHPDPNLLAAFAEHTLLERERGAVSAHLAECADCRESLALAFATAESDASGVAHVARPTPTRHWFPLWRWVAPAAVLCCVFAVVWRFRFEQPAQSKSRSVAPAAIPPKAAILVTPEFQKTQSPPLVAKVVRSEHAKQRASASDRGEMVSAKKGQELESRIPPSPTAEPAGAAIPAAPEMARTRLSPLVAGLPQSAKAKHLAVAPARREAGRESELQNSRPMQSAEGPRPSAPPGNIADAALAAQQAAAPNPTSTFLPKEQVATAARADRALAEGSTAGAARLTRLAGSARANSSTTGVRWSINASPNASSAIRGVVQRSLDGGDTWEDVPVNDQVSFRAIATSGSHVWAGGSDGALFHSPDGGLHWARITVATEDAQLTGAIVSIDARNPNQLKITTNSGEQWIGGDGGRHWKRE
jgi:hypothetical protein